MKPKNKNKTKLVQDKNMKPKKSAELIVLLRVNACGVSAETFEQFYHERCLSGPCAVENPDSRN